MPLFDMDFRLYSLLIVDYRAFFYHICPGCEAMGIPEKSGFRKYIFCPGFISLLNIVASPSCTKYLWATLIAFCFRGWYVPPIRRRAPS